MPAGAQPAMADGERAAFEAYARTGQRRLYRTAKRTRSEHRGPNGRRAARR
ncbi:hypothetical protein ABZ362_09255 [Streptomyces sp. NPDC005951]|uniref:hypothetical protein n=1 Tax=Streptomyces sp. NPDC005951 TaxID=3154573 RepID=UPI0033EE8035